MKPGGRFGKMPGLILGGLVLGAIALGVVGPIEQRADAMSRTIHPCLTGDEVCKTPAPTPKPR
jgi:hypothetical protein